ncbi:membrane protein [Bacillus sp. FJAT-27916]|uniref:CcdC family protein n=1 Tax=Bacillus sp. FJAT-27916 TaxID=1679169 RepID=UPI0006714960|nr:cytochrome c biogenesis protein CcdC [Bacillus sp. FJAT-27916]KMY44585.1 membrane protein [Bacillus sp. FJAT-27916]
MMILAVSTIAAIVMALAVFTIRMKASKKPATLKKIILPPFFMSTGALMYVFEPFRLSGTEIVEAVLLGMFFSIFLIMTSRFEIKEEQIYIKRSKAFVFVLLGLIIVRTLLKFILSSSVDVGEIGGMFFLIAFSMIVPWRVAMYVQYKKLERNLMKPKETVAM